jgi:hypothetical protein
MTTLRTFLPPEPPEKEARPLRAVTEADCEAMDSTFGYEGIRTESGFITFDPVPLDTAKRIARTAQEKAMRAGELRRLPTCFGELV